MTSVTAADAECAGERREPSLCLLHPQSWSTAASTGAALAGSRPVTALRTTRGGRWTSANLIDRWSLGRFQRGAPGDACECGEAELGDAGLSLQGGVELLKLVVGAGEADL